MRRLVPGLDEDTFSDFKKTYLFALLMGGCMPTVEFRKPRGRIRRKAAKYLNHPYKSEVNLLF